MLFKFEFENFKSFSEKTIYKSEVFNSHPNSDFFGLNTYFNEYCGKHHVKSSVIIGKNAGGKSNFINAITSYIAIILNSFENEEIIKLVQPYILCKKYINQPTKLSMDFCINHRIYSYEYHVFKGNIEYEKLSYLEKNKYIDIYTRNNSDIDSIKIYNNFKNLSTIKQNTKKNVLFLSVLNKFNIDFATEIIEYFTENYIVISPSILNADIPIAGKTYKSTLEVLHSGTSLQKHNIINFIKYSDMGISDIKTREIKIKLDDRNRELIEALRKYSGNVGNMLEEKVIQAQYIHNVTDNQGNIINTVSFREDLLSSGTRKLIAISAAIFHVLNNGGILILDEVENTLHHMLVKRILEYFNSIDKNPKNALLITTTHDLLVLDEDIRDDQIWIVDKSQNKGSVLNNLKNYEGITKRTKLLKQYLLGMYSGLPEIIDYD